MRLRSPLYFGCIDRPGHYVFGDAEPRFRSEHWLTRLDGLLPPDDPQQVEGRAKLYHFVGCTLIAFWDRSVDSRKGCNSAFALPGKLTFAEAVKCAKAEFPHVWARFKFEVVEVSE